MVYQVLDRVKPPLRPEYYVMLYGHGIGGKYGIRSVLSGLRILEECVSPDAMLGFEG